MGSDAAVANKSDKIDMMQIQEQLVDAVREVIDYLQMDPVAEEDEASTPLFRHADGSAFSRADVASMVKRLMQGIGLDPAFFGAHSLRIGGATAALAAGISPSLIHVMGRWSSDIYHIYCRLSAEAAAAMAAVVGSTAFEDVEQGEFVSEELEATALELAANRHVDLESNSGVMTHSRSNSSRRSVERRGAAAAAARRGSRIAECCVVECVTECE